MAERPLHATGSCCVLWLLLSWGSYALGIREVGSSLDLWQAFQEPEVTTIRVTKDIVLDRSVWPGDDDLQGGTRDYLIPVTSNITVEGYSEDGRPPSIDFDYMRFRVGIGDGLQLVLRGLRLRGSARDPEEQLVFDFFALGRQCTIVYEDVIAEVAVDHRRSLGRMERLQTLGRPMNESNPGGVSEQRLKILPHTDPLCNAMSGEECTQGAIAFEDFSNVVILTDRKTHQEWGIILNIRRTLLTAIDVSQGWPKSREESSGRLTVVVQNFGDLGHAIQDPRVVTVYVWKDLIYNMSSWPNFDGHHRLKCSLDRSLNVLTHPLSLRRSGMAMIDFNFARGALGITQESTLTLRNLLLDRICRFNDPQCPLPFFDVRPGSQIVVKSGYMRVAVSSSDFEGLDPATLMSLPLPSLTAWKNVLHQVIRLDKCHSTILGPCERLGAVDDVMIAVHNAPPGLDADGGSMEKRTSMLLSNSTLILFDKDKHEMLLEEEIVFNKQGILSVADETQLREAMKNQSVAGVYLTSGLNISASVWPQHDKIVLGRNFYMTTHPSSPVAMVVDFDFLPGRVVVQTGQTLSLEWMNFTRLSDNGDNMHYIPFFAWQDNSTIFLKDVLGQMAIEPMRYASGPSPSC